MNCSSKELPSYPRYGDITPKTIPGRIFGVIWTLVSLVLNGILIGSLTSSVTTLTLPPAVKLYGTTVITFSARSIVLIVVSTCRSAGGGSRRCRLSWAPNLRVAQEEIIVGTMF